MPYQTDTNYAVQDSNYIVYNTQYNINKLFLFIGGSLSSPGDYAAICNFAGNSGFDIISLRYPNEVGVFTTLAESDDNLVFDKFRQEICFGTPQSIHIAVDTLNSIYTRTVKLLQFLAANYTSQNWNQYLLTADTPDWSKILVGGHSQGAGHACYLANYDVRKNQRTNITTRSFKAECRSVLYHLL
jgi:hypothetical protein